MKIVLIGGPGSGKGTRAKIMSQQLNLPHISTGDIFRKHLQEETEISNELKSYVDNGKLVPDELTIKLVNNHLKNEDFKNGFILDGFPRTIEQAKELEEVDHVLFFDCPEEILINRLGNRLTCKDCKHIFNLNGLKPKIENKCDHCNGDLIQREDDKEEVIKERLSVYKKQTEPLFNFFKNKAKSFNTGKELNESISEILFFLR